MKISEVLLADFDSEVASTRRVLERVPEDKLDFKPHEKSMALKSLAVHVAGLPNFGHVILTTPSMDMAKTPFPKTEFESVAKLVETADAASARVRAVLAGLSDEELTASWEFRFGAHVISNSSRLVTFRTGCFNHLIHHRGQLNVYLRLLDVKVPGIYGPSADEPFGG
jgi:uncharacterized damage-inducible protein DinB